MSVHGPSVLPAEQIRVPEGHSWRRLPMIFGALGVIGLGGAAALGWGTKQFFFSYLVAYCYFLSIALGGLFFVVAQFAARAGWSVAVRRIAENAMWPLWLFAVLFVPIAIGAHDLYHHWFDHQVVANDPILQGKAPYLNATAFYVRAAIYFVIWAAVALYFHRKSTAQDNSGDVTLTRKLQVVSGPAIALFAFSVSFAAFDWIMSLDPHWYSTMFGPYFFSGCVVGIFALMTLLGVLMRRGGLLTDVISTEHYHDLGKYLFAFTVFWSYIAFSQFMLIWYGNIPEETVWFAHRGVGLDVSASGWYGVSVLLVVGHFAAPFFFLMPRGIKRRGGALFLAAAWLLVIHYVDIYWQIMPTLHHHGPHLTLMDAATMVGIGGLFLAAMTYQMVRHPLLPVKDPRLAESLSYENV